MAARQGPVTVRGIRIDSAQDQEKKLGKILFRRFGRRRPVCVTLSHISSVSSHHCLACGRQ